MSLELGSVGSAAYSATSDVDVYRAVNRRLVEMVDVDERSLVLDVGCGPGLVTDLLLELRSVRAVWAVDHDPVMVAEARERVGGRAGVLHAAVSDLPRLVPSASMDVAFLANCVHLLDDPVAALRAIGTVVAPGGQLALNTAFFDGAASKEDRLLYLRLLLRARRLAGSRARAGADRPRRGHAARRTLTVDYLTGALDAAGFTATAVERRTVAVPGTFLLSLAATPMFAQGVLPSLEPDVAAAVVQESMVSFAHEHLRGDAPGGIERTWLYILATRRTE